MFSQLLIAASLSLAAYADIKERLVSDLVWIPGAVGVASLFFLLPSEAVPLAIRIGLVGALGFAMARLGYVGEADAIGLVVATANPSILSLVGVMLGTGVVAIAHIVYLHFSGVSGRSHTIPLEQFRAESKWIPKAIITEGVSNDVSKNVNLSREEVGESAAPGSMIEVEYGVPTVAYIAAGYVAYLVYTLLFNFEAFAMLP